MLLRAMMQPSKPEADARRAVTRQSASAACAVVVVLTTRKLLVLHASSLVSIDQTPASSDQLVVPSEPRLKSSVKRVVRSYLGLHGSRIRPRSLRHFVQVAPQRQERNARGSGNCAQSCERGQSSLDQLVFKFRESCQHRGFERILRVADVAGVNGERVSWVRVMTAQLENHTL